MVGERAAVPERVAWGVALLDPRPTEHLLEVGCGSGHAIALLAARLKARVDVRPMIAGLQE